MTFVQDSAAFVGLILGVGLIVLATRRIPRSNGKNVFAHLVYLALALGFFFLLPLDVKSTLFSPLAVIVVGTVYPVYESIRAVCTIDEADDTTWLSYWIAQGIVSFSTEWIDGLGNQVSTSWNMFEFFFYLWLILPQTDGAALIFNIFWGPIIAPIIQPIVKKADGIVARIMTIGTNMAHLGFVWVAFVILPAGIKRTVWILLGTLYPLGSSIISVTTPEVADDTYWLTYWSCFGILFLIVDLLENFIGFFPGFYTLAIAVTIYLMLPLFRGADVVFRTILVPLAGLQELLVRKDAEDVKKQALAGLSPERREIVMNEIAEAFKKGATESKKAVTPVSPNGYSEIV